MKHIAGVLVLLLPLSMGCAGNSPQESSTTSVRSVQPPKNGQYRPMMEGLIEHYRDGNLTLTTDLEGKPYNGRHTSTHGRPNRIYKNGIPVRTYPIWAARWFVCNDQGQPLDENGNVVTFEDWVRKQAPTKRED